MVDFDSEKQLLDFLEKNYIVKENKCFSRHEDIHVWGKNIVEEISVIFSYSSEFCIPIFKLWTTYNGLSDEEYSAGWTTNLFSEEFGIDSDGQLRIDLMNQNILSGLRKIHLRGEE